MPVTGFFSTMSSSSQSNVPPTSGVKVESTRVGTRCSMAISTERVCSTLAPSEAISSISSKAIFSSRRALGTMRGSVV